MELQEVMRTNGAARVFTDEAVPDEVLFDILDDARFAPSGGNQQAWHVIVVRDRDVRRRLAALSTPIWERYLTEQAAGYRAYSVLEPAPTDLAIPDGLPEHPLFTQIDTVPIVLVVTVALRALATLDRDLDRPPIVSGASIYPFVQNILLAARDRGLGGVITTFLAAAEPEAAGLLNLPDDQAVAAFMGLGVPRRQVTRLNRRAVASFTTVDAFDGPAFDGPAFGSSGADGPAFGSSGEGAR